MILLHKGTQPTKANPATDVLGYQLILCTLYDSGTISEEYSISGFSAISLRQSIKKPEAQNSGSIILTRFDSIAFRNSISLVIKEKTDGKVINIPEDYQIDDTFWRVNKLIIGNCNLSNFRSRIN